LTVSFELDGTRFTALNGGPAFKFTEAISFAVRCDSQEEIDDYWRSSLPAARSPVRVAQGQVWSFWQIVPARLPELVKHPKRCRR